MDKHERKSISAVVMELSDTIERLHALKEYITELLNSERRTNVETPNNSNSGGN